MSEPERFKVGNQAAASVDSATQAESANAAQIEQQVVDGKWMINRRVLLVADLLLLAIGAWLITASPMAHTTAALTVGIVLLVIGCVLGCVAMLPQGSSK